MTPARLPAPPALPRDIVSLHCLATLGFCPVRGAERRERSAVIGRLIGAALLEGAGHDGERATIPAPAA